MVKNEAPCNARSRLGEPRRGIRRMSKEIERAVGERASLPDLLKQTLLPMGVAVGGLAIGAVAIGALAIGALAIGRLRIGKVRLKDVEIDRLVVRRLEVLERD